MIIERGTDGVPIDVRPAVATGRVSPIRYQNPRLRGDVGYYLGKAGSDDLLAAVLWTVEARACRWAIEVMAENRVLLSEEIQAVEHQLGSPLRASVRRKATGELARVLAILKQAYGTVEQAHGRAEELFAQLRRHFGEDPGEVMTSARQEGEANTIFTLLDEADEAVGRSNDSWAAYGSACALLVETAVRREAFAATETSVRVEQYAQLDGPGLERLAARLLERDGLTVLRSSGGSGDQGVDVIGRLPTGELVAIQSKYRQRKSVGPDTVRALNGSARQLHGASYAVVLTNTTFTDQARRDAERLDIRLVDGDALTDWATWGDTLYDVAGIPTVPTEVAARV
ncbi:restriction endonuclease [Kitasatospora phosalacinea]|uniref:restriction endonuclease n=1 Tax=Kitasatospora phosalacinea TaxID=2065 RepID=UPI0035D66286